MTQAGQEVLRPLALWLDGEAETLAPELARAMLEGEPEWAHGGLLAHVVEDVRVTLAGLTDAMGAGGVSRATGARGVSRLATWAADEGLPWAMVDRAWARCRRELLDRALGWLAQREWADPGQAAAAMRTVVAYLSAFGDDVGAAMAASYEGTASRVERGGDHRQGEHIDDLLASRSVREDELWFELRSDHLAAVAWGAQRTRALRDLAEALGCDVTIEPRRERDWAWFHGRPELDPRHEEVVRSFRPPPESFLALGAVGSGADGFTVSHRQACLAERVAVISGAPVTLFGDVALEAFALGDETLARRFVDGQLGALAEDRPRTETLRRTLEAYFEAGNRATAAAAALDVHERTVSYRIRTAEERLGRYLMECQDGLALALRLRRLFGPTQRPGAPPPASAVDSAAASAP